MADVSEIKIPVIPQEFELNDHDYPISPGENLLRALKHEKPLWMPNLFGGGLPAPMPAINTPSAEADCDYRDWFGVGFRYSERQGSPTPILPVLSEAVNWEKEIRWPDLSKFDLSVPDKDFVRDSGRLVYTWLPSVCIQQLYALEDFEQSLVDLITEPAACRALFEALVDFHIEVFDERNRAYRFDYVIYGDDWGTMRAPFFSVETMRETMLKPTARFLRHIKEAGVKTVFHNCGLINDFIPAIAEEIKPDAMDLQFMNDIAGMMKRYGAGLTFDLQNAGDRILYDPQTTHAAIRQKARECVDIFGAHVMPGAGGVVFQSAMDAEKANVFWDEIYAYSLEKYRGLHR
ncbi:MAG: hypothetical protein LBE16_03785 [Clostridiales Family XIII bacterium]|nr:hypothetical protein [Clostridiales Family XIII bacterium]